MSADETQGGKQSDTEQLREEIADTREELGETVEALADKADVKSQAKAKASEVTQQAQEQKAPIAAIAGGLLALLLLVWLRRRR